MQLFTSTLSRDDLENIADAMGIRLYNYDSTPTRVRGKYKGKMEHNFILRPVTGRFQRGGNGRLGNMNKNKIWAVSWAGHYVFMKAVFLIDPDAVIKTGLGVVTGEKKGVEYHGAMDFAAYAEMTGDKNVGSMIEPQEYRESQYHEHVEWETTDDLDHIAADIHKVPA